VWSQYDHRRPQASAKGALTTPYKIEKCYRIKKSRFYHIRNRSGKKILASRDHRKSRNCTKIYFAGALHLPRSEAYRSPDSVTGFDKVCSPSEEP